MTRRELEAQIGHIKNMSTTHESDESTSAILEGYRCVIDLFRKLEVCAGRMPN